MSSPIESDPHVIFEVRKMLLEGDAFNGVMQTRVRGPRSKVLLRILENSKELLKHEQVLRDGGVSGELFRTVLNPGDAAHIKALGEAVQAKIQHLQDVWGKDHPLAKTETAKLKMAWQKWQSLLREAGRLDGEAKALPDS